MANHMPEPTADPLRQLEKAVMQYLTHLNSGIPLDDEFRLLKARVITAACNVVASPGSAPAPQEAETIQQLQEAVKSEKEWRERADDARRWLSNQNKEQAQTITRLQAEKERLTLGHEDADREFRAVKSACLTLQADLAARTAQLQRAVDDTALAADRWDIIERLTRQHNEWKARAEKAESVLASSPSQEDT